MTVQELIDWCSENDVSLDTPIALRAKDDYFLVADGVYLDEPYFGNSREGEEWMEENAPRDDDGEINYDQTPEFLILDTFRG